MHIGGMPLWRRTASPILPCLEGIPKTIFQENIAGHIQLSSSCTHWQVRFGQHLIFTSLHSSTYGIWLGVSWVPPLRHETKMISRVISTRPGPGGHATSFCQTLISSIQPHISECIYSKWYHNILLMPCMSKCLIVVHFWKLNHLLRVCLTS